MRWLQLSLPVLFQVALSSIALASSSGITYHGRILEPDGITPVAGLVTFNIQIRTPNNANCLMYSETQVADITGTNGVFALTIGDGSRTDSTGLTFGNIFANQGTLSFDPSTCAGPSSYTPAIGDGRNLAVTFQSSVMSLPESLPVQAINYTPLAIEAQQIDGLPATSLLRFIKSDGTLVNTTPLNDVEYASLIALIDGSSNLYSKPGNAVNGTPIFSTAGSISSPSVGNMWLDTSGGTGHDVLKIYTDSGVQTVGLSATGFVNSVAASATAGNPIVVTGGSAPTVDISRATSSNNGYLSAADFSSFASKASGSLANGNIFVGNISDSAVGVAMTGDVSIVASGLTKVIGIQGVGIGTSSPTTAGEVLRYDGSRYGASFLTMNDIKSLTSSNSSIFPLVNCTAGQTLNYSSVTDQFTCTTIDATQIANLGTAAFVNVGTGGSQIPVLDSSGRLPAIDGSQLTNLSAAALASGSVDPARLPASSKIWALNGTSAYSTNAGYVGIGTTAPGYTLDVNGSAHLSGSVNLGVTTVAGNLGAFNNFAAPYVSDGAYPAANISSSNNTAGDGNYDFFSAKAKNTASTVQTAYWGAVATTTGYAPAFVVGQTTAAATYSEALRVDQNGNVGIGTTAPAYKLDIAGQVNASALSINGTPITAAGGSSWAASGSNIYNTNSNGNVGIGTTAPVTMLNLSGGALTVSPPSDNTAQTMDFTKGNVQTSSYSGTTTVKVCGIKDGGQYSAVLTGYPSGTVVTLQAYTDSACSISTNLDFGGSTSGYTSTFTTGNNVSLVSIVYVANRGVAYAAVATNFYH